MGKKKRILHSPKFKIKGGNHPITSRINKTIEAISDVVEEIIAKPAVVEVQKVETEIVSEATNTVDVAPTTTTTATTTTKSTTTKSTTKTKSTWSKKPATKTKTTKSTKTKKTK